MTQPAVFADFNELWSLQLQYYTELYDVRIFALMAMRLCAGQIDRADFGSFVSWAFLRLRVKGKGFWGLLGFRNFDSCVWRFMGLGFCGLVFHGLGPRSRKTIRTNASYICLSAYGLLMQLSSIIHC